MRLDDMTKPILTTIAGIFMLILKTMEPVKVGSYVLTGLLFYVVPKILTHVFSDQINQGKEWYNEKVRQLEIYIEDVKINREISNIKSI